jgi:hypothetical protein
MRSRGLKPGIFKNEALAEITPPWGRLVFMGLWGLADREGRLLDRPGHIAVEVFPYDLANGRFSVSQVNEILDELAKGPDPFIIRYEGSGQKIIQVVNFKKHQSPHHTEKASELPEYQGAKKGKRTKKITVRPPRKNGEITVNPPKSNGENRPDTGLLTLDSGHRTPDTGVWTPEVLTKEDPLSVQDLAVLWNKMAPPELAKANLPFNRATKEMTQIEDALKRHPEREWWEEVIMKIHQSPFLRGNNDKRWKCNIDFMLKKAEEILDGKYDEGIGPESSSSRRLRVLRDFVQRGSATSFFTNEDESGGSN